MLRRTAPHAVGVVVLVLAMLLIVQSSHAAGTLYSIEDIGGQVGLGTSDLKQTIIRIIQWTLSILALLAVSLIIYGGFIWMTAAGNEQNVEKAKKIISAALMGLIVVLLAWAIVIFVAQTTRNVSTS